MRSITRRPLCAAVVSILAVSAAAAAHAQAVSLEGNWRIKSTPIGGIRLMGAVTPPANLPPFWHEQNNEAGPVEATISFAEDGSCAVNLFARVTDPEGQSLTLTEPFGDWPAGCTVDYDNGLISSVATTPGTGSVTVRACEDLVPTNCDQWNLDWEVIAAGGGAPFVKSAIPNQVGLFQGVALSLDVAGNFEDPDSDPMTFSATAGLSGHGLSISSAGLITGTPNSQAVTDSPFNVTIKADDVVDGFITDTFTMTVSALPGDLLSISAGTASVDCSTFESGGPVDGGDILQFAVGSRGRIAFTKCHGTAAAPIVIRNHSSGQTIVTASSGTAPLIEFTDSDYFTLDGSTWSGKPAGECGVSVSGGVRSRGTTQCGLKFEQTGTAAAQHLMRFAGRTAHFTIQNFELAGNRSGGIGVSVNDHAITDVAMPWRDGISVQHAYIHDIGASVGECMYIGPNQGKGDSNLRNVDISYNIVEDCSRDGINAKSVLDGVNAMNYNDVARTGLVGAADQNAGLNIDTQAPWTIVGNRVVDPGGNGLQMNWKDEASKSPLSASQTITFYSNALSKAGGNAGASGDAIRVSQGAGTAPLVFDIRNPTIATTTENGVDVAASIACTVTNGIFAGITGTPVVNCTGTNNRGQSPEVAVSTQNFVNAANDDLHLTATSPACGQATVGAVAPADIDGSTRPLEGSSEQGADESTICP